MGDELEPNKKETEKAWTSYITDNKVGARETLECIMHFIIIFIYIYNINVLCGGIETRSTKY